MYSADILHLRKSFLDQKDVFFDTIQLISLRPVRDDISERFILIGQPIVNADVKLNSGHAGRNDLCLFRIDLTHNFELGEYTEFCARKTCIVFGQISIGGTCNNPTGA